MFMKERILVFVIILLLVFNLLVALKPSKKQIVNTLPSANLPAAPVQPSVPEQPKIEPKSISNPTPNYLSYSGIIQQLQEWKKEAPDLVEVGTYGKTTRQQDIYYIKITNPNTTNKKSALITSCIHGNEPHATGTVMAYIGNILKGYGRDEVITKLVDEREIYFVPVVSPDSYPNSRYVDGVDPNRDYDNRKSAPVRAIQSFFNEKKFNAVWSGHTWGRVFLIPWGEKMQNCPDHDSFSSIMKECGDLANYRVIRACDLYNASGGLNKDYAPIRYGEPGYDPKKANSPIYGAEMDWYYKNGAFGVVCEYGTHQRIPTPEEIKSEFDRTFKAVLKFIEKAPVVELKIK